jgi:hypothetical protein
MPWFSESYRVAYPMALVIAEELRSVLRSTVICLNKELHNLFFIYHLAGRDGKCSPNVVTASLTPVRKECLFSRSDQKLGGLTSAPSKPESGSPICLRVEERQRSSQC